MVSAFEKAVKLLSIREHSRRELEMKLLDKGYQKTEVEEALSKLEEKNWLSDQRFASEFIRSRMRRSPEGKSVLRARLMQKGCSKDAIVSSIDEFWENGLYKEPLRTAYMHLKERKGSDYSRAYYLKKGFTQAEIREALENV